MIDVSIIILTYKRPELIEQCLNSLFASTFGISKEVIVVDNTPDYSVINYLNNCKHEIISFHSEENLHFAGGCNCGVSYSKGKDLLFLNNDTIIHNDFISPMLENFSDDRVGIVGAKCLYPNGTIQHAGVGFKVSGPNARPVPCHVYKNWPGEHPYVNKKKTFQSVTAACMAVRRECYNQLNGFDEIFKTGKEDVDFCLRAGVAGWKIVYEPRACIIHLEHQSPGRHDFGDYNNEIERQRWSGKVKDDIQQIKNLENVIK